MSKTVPEQLAARLAAHNQTHLLRWCEELSQDEHRTLIEQIEAVDFGLIERLIAEARYDPTAATETSQARAERADPPCNLVQLPGSPAEQDEWQEPIRLGEELLAAGKLGIILVAGGQGTRLGFEHPKGMYPMGPVSGKSLFQLLAEQALARSRQAGVTIAYYVMTSDATHAETVAFFEEHDFFGLSADDVRFFRQGNMPAVEILTGKLLLADKDWLADSPDGHGGMLAALSGAGLLEDMQRRGVEYLYYHQVDNPTAIVGDPAFLGFHVLRDSKMSTKVVAKRSAEEKMGVVCSLDGQTQIFEYSDMPPEIAAKTDASGHLLHWAGNTAIHMFDRSFLERLVADELSLPFHLAHKKVDTISETGERVRPTEPNAIKYERFIFDALPHARRALVVEADRRREFNPVKNAEGDDSPATAKAAMIALGSDWLRQAGAKFPDGAAVEISPLFAMDADQLRQKVEPGTEFIQSVLLQ